LEKQLSREINYVLLSAEEFKSRREQKEAFLEDLWQHKRITLIGPP